MIGGVAGAPIGGGLMYGMSRQAPNEGALARVAELEQQKERGEGSFAASLELVSKKMQLGLQETARNHPLAATAAGAVVGAATGTTIGQGFSKLPDHVESLKRYWANRK